MNVDLLHALLSRQESVFCFSGIAVLPVRTLVLRPKVRAQFLRTLLSVKQQCHNCTHHNGGDENYGAGSCHLCSPAVVISKPATTGVRCGAAPWPSKELGRRCAH